MLRVFCLLHFWLNFCVLVLNYFLATYLQLFFKPSRRALLSAMSEGSHNQLPARRECSLLELSR